jgi:hypothetical protein
MESSNVTVYSFDVFGVHGRCFMPFKATREDIELHYNGAVLDSTAEVVPVTALDSEGHYRRWSGWTEQHFALIH